MAELAEDVIRYLISKGIATAIGTDAFMGYLPDTDEVPPGALVVYDTGGGPSQFAIPDLKRTMQISIRDMGYEATRLRAWLAFNALDNPLGRVYRVNGRNALIKALQPPTVIKRDDQGRITFVFNISIITTRD